ncbi:MAG: hypothetical protein IKC59_03990 [Clostridia bacterium]|nr:hypothetical protein [Clostridia bacterium]
MRNEKSVFGAFCTDHVVRFARWSILVCVGRGCDTDVPVEEESTTDAGIAAETPIALFGCGASMSLGTGLIFLLTVGAAGVMLKKKEN